MKRNQHFSALFFFRLTEKDGSLDRLAQNLDSITLSFLISVMLNPDFFYFCFENTVDRDQSDKPSNQCTHCFHSDWKCMH